MEEDPELKNVKAIIRSTLMSVKEGVPATRLNRDYQEIIGESIPYKKFGFSTYEDFILSIPDVVKIQRRGPEVILHAVADESTSHIQALVNKQRSKKVKKPIRRPRGGGASRFMGRPMGPRKPGPSRGGFVHTPTHQRHGIPTFISPPQGKSLTPVMISIGNSSSGTRTISVGRTTLLHKAMNDANRDSLIQRQQQSPSASKFEVPPRFRNRLGQKSPPQQQQQQQKASHSTPVRRPRQQHNLSTMENGEVYVLKLREYLRERQQMMKFDTSAAVGGYCSSITVNKQTYGSGDIYRTAAEAEAAAAQNACKDLALDKPQQQESCMPLIDWNKTARAEMGGPTLPPGQLNMVRSRVKEILQNKINGLWGTRIPYEYKERYKEEPPEKLMDLIKTWKDIARVEFVPNTDRDIVYPVQDDENKNLKIPHELLFNSTEGVVVYTTYLQCPGYFCVQREDSCIDEITEALQTHCKKTQAPAVDLLKPGRYCAGLFSGDGNWTRAEILANRGNGTMELLFVDYGNVEHTIVQDIRWLSPDVAKHPVQAVTCKLYGIQPLQDEKEWSDAASTKFASIVGEEALVAIPQNIQEDMVEVQLYLKSDLDKSISQKLVDAGVVQSTVELDEDDDTQHPVDIVLPEDKEWDVHVTFISSTTESVMLRLVGEEYSDKLDQFQAKLLEAFRNSSPETPINTECTHIAYDDGLYHRVRVLSQDEKKVTCYFLDHGDTDELLPEQLCPIDPTVNRLLPYQAVEVSLYGLEDVCTNITALQSICELALGKTCVAEVVERDDIPSVILYDTSGDTDININETILRTVEAEGGGIDSSSSTPQRVLSPAPSTGDIHSGDRKTCDKLAVNKSLSKPNEISTSAINHEQNSVKTDQNANPVGSKIYINSEIPIDNLTRSLENSKIQEKRQQASVSNNSSANGLIQSTNNCSEEKLIPSPTQPQVSRPILGRSPSGRIAAEVGAVQENLTATHPKRFQIPPVGEYLDVHINFVHDPSNFVCMPFLEMGKLNQLLIDMIKYYKVPMKSMQMSEIEEGKIYAGHKDGVVYRVRVSKIVNADVVSVWLVDIGEYTCMMVSELQPLIDQFRTLPMLAFSATLGSITPESGTWSEAAKYLFIELAQEKDLVGLVQGYDADKEVVNLRLIDTSNEDTDLCIDEVLVKKQFAKHVDT